MDYGLEGFLKFGIHIFNTFLLMHIFGRSEQ